MVGPVEDNACIRIHGLSGGTAGHQVLLSFDALPPPGVEDSMGACWCFPVLSGGRMDFSDRMPGFGPIESMVFSSVESLYPGYGTVVRVFHFEESGVFGSFNFAGSTRFERIMLGILRASL
jgi:hypothetical protein